MSRTFQQSELRSSQRLQILLPENKKAVSVLIWILIRLLTACCAAATFATSPRLYPLEQTRPSHDLGQRSLLANQTSLADGSQVSLTCWACAAVL
jgi:hypothetical protein